MKRYAERAAHELVEWWDDALARARDEGEDLAEPDWWELHNSIEQQDSFYEALYDYDPCLFDGGLTWGEVVRPNVARCVHVAVEFARQKRL